MYVGKKSGWYDDRVFFTETKCTRDFIFHIKVARVLYGRQGHIYSALILLTSRH